MPFDNQTYPETTAMKMLKILAGGKRWVRNSMSRRIDTDGEVTGFCLMGAYAATKVGEEAVHTGVYNASALWVHRDFALLERICQKIGGRSSVDHVNDYVADWPMIERILREMHHQELSTLVQKEP